MVVTSRSNDHEQQHNHHQNPIQIIKEDDKFFSRLLSKEASSANTSCRVYYGGVPGAIPFTWESRPGTPKHVNSDDTIPPLTPPPSHFCSPKSSAPVLNRRKPSLLRFIFPKLVGCPGKSHVTPTSSLSSVSSSSSLSWSSSSLSSPTALGKPNKRLNQGRRRRCISWSSFPLEDKEEEEEEEETRGVESGGSISTLCFGGKRKNSGGCHR